MTRATPHSPTTAVPPTHGCVRCGAPIALEDAMCERCNPLGLKQPSASQVHGTVFVGILVFVVILAVLGRVSVSGIGPFDASIAGVSSSPPGLSVTLTVRNLGSSAGASTCRVYDRATGDLGPSTAFVQTPRIEAGRTTTFSTLVTGLGLEARPLGVSCEAP